jgi:hypothetical protein
MTEPGTQRGTARRLTAPALILALIILITAVPASAYDRSSGERPGDPGYLADGGIYTIRNAGTGKYLFAYNYSLKLPGKLCLTALKSGETAQYFRLRASGDSWQLVPRSEDEKYAVSYPSLTPEGTSLSKVPADGGAGLTGFDITFLPGGVCTIAPSSGDNIRAVLAASYARDSEKNDMAVLEDYVSGRQTQLWVLEKIGTEKLTAAFSNTRVKLYSTGTFYARKYPDNADNSDIVWTSSDEDVLLIGPGGNYCALSAGTSDVTASADGCSVTISVEVVDADCFTWYSQNSITASNWDGTNLEGLRFYADGRTRVFALEYEDNPSTCWLTTGCTICSCAMVLHNLGATLTTGYDLRSGQTNGLPADPYTVALANSGNYGVSSVSERMTGNPVYVRWSYIASRFTVDGEEIGYKKYYSPTKKFIKSLLEEHPAGVIIGFQQGSSTHYMVAAGVTDPDEQVSSKISFIVYDPSAYYASRGDGIPLSQTYTRGGYIFAVYVFDVVSNLG